MDHYLEIRLLPDPEFPPNVLMNALFAKLHRALVSSKISDIGISFPDVQENKPTLGDRLRLHSTKASLKAFMDLQWLKGMSDHIAVNQLTPIPETVSYRTVSRVQTKSNPERLRRRLIKRKGISEKEALSAIPDSVGKQLKLPYINVKSQSTEQSFRLFIQHKESTQKSDNYNFNAYGLSRTSTIPWF